MNDEQGTTGADIKATAPERAAPAFEHPALNEPTELLKSIPDETETLDQLLQTAARWAEIQGSDTVRSPHLFAALLGTGTHARWDWLRQQKPDIEWLKQKVLLMVAAQNHPRTAEDLTSVSESVRKILERARRQAGAENRISVEDVYLAFFAEDGGAVGEQLTKWGVKMPRAD